MPAFQVIVAHYVQNACHCYQAETVFSETGHQTRRGTQQQVLSELLPVAAVGPACQGACIDATDFVNSCWKVHIMQTLLLLVLANCSVCLC